MIAESPFFCRVVKKCFPLFFLPTLLLSNLNFQEFDAYQGRWTREEIEDRLGRFLQKDGRVGSYFSLTSDSLIVYDAPETQKEREIEYHLKLASKKNGKGGPLQKKGLVGLKVAIDPGHLGGPYARLEERYIDIPPSLERKNSIQFDEGTLSYLTAIYLKILLEKEGAVVMITRDQIGKGVYAEDFFDWLKKHPQLWVGEVSLNKLFRKYYNPLDLRARAEKINRFSPDLTLVIHYNSHHVEEEYSSNNCVASKNYNLVFVPGAFCRNELAEQESRYEFLRLLVTEDLPKSQKLCSAVLKEFGSSLQVPVVSKADGARYLESVCLKVEEGVFARNLALTRLVHGPVCYGETLIQNNIDECVNLSRTDFIIDGRPCSSRIKQVSEAYFEGIKKYLNL
jgi:N-acetylmuramoyl-L-alanine amidase